MSEPTPVSPDEPLHPRAPDPSPPPPPERSDLPARLLTSVVLVSTVLYVIAIGGLVYLAFIIAVVLLGQREFYRLIEEKGAHPIVSYGMAAGAALPVVAYLGNEYHATLILIATLLAVMVRSVGRAEIAEALVSISGTFFGVVYVGWLLSHAVVLRFFYGVASEKYGAEVVDALGFVSDSGAFFMVFCLTAVVWSDAGAYFAGRAWGRRKLAPRISPGKTVEGAIGGIAAGTLGGLGVKLVFEMVWPELSAAMPWGLAAGLGFLLAIVGMVGDLVESLLKRDAQTKDAGSLLPGMGGVLDRIDSALLGIPVMYYMLLFSTWLRMGAS